MLLYREIDIASAKPTKAEMEEIKHFGVDEIYPNEHSSIITYEKVCKKALECSKDESRNLLIVGGSSFYLKSLMEGLSRDVSISEEVKDEVERIAKNREKAYALLSKIDEEYAKKISKNDLYRISKALEIFFEKKTPPSLFFATNQKEALLGELDIFEIEIDKDELRENIKQRSQEMLRGGLIDEVCFLEKKYGRSPKSMKAIGIIEVLEYLDRECELQNLCKIISTHTIQLAKRQQTFNKTQFLNKKSMKKDMLEDTILSFFVS